MAIDLRHPLKHGIDNLLEWRKKYSKTEYPEKIAMNVFYRKYTIDSMFPSVANCFSKNLFGKPKVKWNDFNEGFQKLKAEYSLTATSKIQPQLKNLLSNPLKQIGNTNYNSFIPLISEASKGNSSKLEELEYAYLYYLLTDECILLWGAFGGTGLSKIDAIGKMSGLVIEVGDINSYAVIDQILGQLCSAPYLKENYKAMPPNV